MSKKDKTKPPFFIVGCNRTGTSLLRTMLNHHPDIAVPLESIFFIDYLKAGKRVDIELQKKLLVGEPMLNEWGIKLNYHDFNKSVAAGDLIRVAHEKYAQKEGKKYWGNKTPRLTRHFELIKEALPKALFIHMIRDPRAVALSLSKTKIHRSNVYFGAKRWLRFVQSGLEMEKKFKKDVLRMRYEDLVKDPEKMLRIICNFLGLRFSRKMLNYYTKGNNEYRTFHNNEHKNLKLPPYVKRINAWKNELTKKEVEVIDSICKDVAIKVGYKFVLNNPKICIFDTYYYRLHRMVGFVMQIFHYLLYWPKYLIYTIWRKIRLGTMRDEVRGIYY